MPTKAVDVSELLAKAPRNCWLALNEDETKVVGRGENVADAVAEAKKVGIEDPIVIWAPKEWVPSVFLTEANRCESHIRAFR